MCSTAIPPLPGSRWKKGPDRVDQSGAIQLIAALGTELKDAARILRSDPRAAAAMARETLERYPGQPQMLMLLASARRLSGDPAGARRALQLLAKAEPNLAAVHCELGLLLREMGDGNGAVAAFSRVVELEPRHPQAWRILGDLFADMGRTEDAAAAYVKHFGACAAVVARVEALVEGSQDRLPDAERTLREMIRLHPTDLFARRMLAKVYARLGRRSDAEKVAAQTREFL